jgi:hypothetical protein
MVLRLGKWMRIMGMDTEYAKINFDDDMIRAYCDETGRVLITRDVQLSRAQKNSILIRSTEIKLQIMEITKSITPKKNAFLTICTVCNTTLEPCDPESCLDRIPPDVIGSRTSICRNCGRIYWCGSHTENMLKILENCGVYN